MAEPIKLFALDGRDPHPNLTEISEAVRALKQLSSRFGSYDELLQIQLKAATLRLSEFFGDDDWVAKRLSGE